jgi:predicted ArsR family transcriptional regulator
MCRRGEGRVKAAGDAILFQLKSLGEAQAEMLARRLGISVQAVRQRLERLLTENLVAFSDHAHGRGQPRRLWSLAPGTASLFPDTHAQLTVDLIGTIRGELGETALAKLLERRREQITAFYRKRLAREPDIARKLMTLADMRSAEGYLARVEALANEGFLLVEDHCRGNELPALLPHRAAGLSEPSRTRLAHRTGGPSCHRCAPLRLPNHSSMMGGMICLLRLD